MQRLFGANKMDDKSYNECMKRIKNLRHGSHRILRRSISQEPCFSEQLHVPLGAVLFIKQFKTNTCLVNREKIKDSPVIKRLQKAFLVNFHNIMRSKSCFYFSNRLDESVESVYLDKFTDESRQIELLMIRKKVPVGYEWNYKTLVMGSLNDNCMPISVLLDTAKIFKAKLIIYQEHCHDMMLDPAWEIVAEDILGFILV